MEPSALHSQIAQYEEQDKSLHFALGMAHIAAQIITLVSDQTASATVTALNPIPGEETPLPEAFLFFILGLFSFSDRYLDTLASLNAGRPVPATSGTDSSRESKPRLAIRDLLS